MLSKKKKVQGRPLSTEEKFYYQWGYETIKNNIKILNDVLRQLMMLNTALLAAAIGFLDKIEALSWSKSIVLILLTLSLLISFMGILPYKSKAGVNKPNMIKRHKRKTLFRKKIFLDMAVGLLFGSFILLIIDLLTR